MQYSNTRATSNQDDGCDPRLISLGIEFAQAYQTFADHLRLGGRSAKTIGFYDQQVLPFLRWCYRHEVRSLAAISRGNLRSHLQFRSVGHSRATFRAAHRAIRRFLNFCVDDKLIAVSPMSNIAAPQATRRILPAIEEQDVPKLLKGAQCSRDTAIISDAARDGSPCRRIDPTSWG